MKVRDLLKSIENYQKQFPDFLDWDIYSEQLISGDKAFKRRKHIDNLPWYDLKNGQSWKTIKDSEGWEYFECCGFNTIFTKEKIFTINVNF